MHDAQWWKAVESRRGPSAAFHGSFVNMKMLAEKILVEHEVIPLNFSHFGIVVADLKASLDRYRQMDALGDGVTVDWVDAYEVRIARWNKDGVEWELIQPVGAGFFHHYLREQGEALHHVGFFVADIESCMRRLDRPGMRSIDPQPRVGSHGLIGFIQVERLGGRYIELCQVR